MSPRLLTARQRPSPLPMCTSCTSGAPSWLCTRPSSPSASPLASSSPGIPYPLHSPPKTAARVANPPAVPISLITINHSWRVIYEVASALVGLVLLAAFFTFPETAYVRDTDEPLEHSAEGSSEKVGRAPADVERAATPPTPSVASYKTSYLSSLSIFPQAADAGEPAQALLPAPGPDLPAPRLVGSLGPGRHHRVRLGQVQ